MRTTFLILSAVLLALGAQALTCGDYTYTDNGGQATITGYTGPGGALTIPSPLCGLPVTSIGSEAFSGCTGLTSVTIPSGVTSIGSEAFSGCTSLTSVTTPASVTTIGYWAFLGCRGLTSVTIPAGVTI